jgi:glucokinase
MAEICARAVGCDIGGTNCKVGLVDSSGTVLEGLSFGVDHEAGISIFLETLCDEIGSLVKDRDIKGIGVLLPGYLKKNRSVPYIMVNIPMLEDVPLKQKLEDRFGISVALDIDRNGPCLAEYLFRDGEPVSRLMYVTIGTGVGVGLTVDGKICRICNDSIGELGHVNLEPDGYSCVCGNRGCVETIVSKNGIARIAERLGLDRFFETLLPEQLYEAAERGNSDAVRVFHEFGRYLGVSLVAFANIFSPDLIIIGGGLSGASGFYLDIAEKYLNEHWFERETKQIPVRKTAFGEHAGIVGAASLALI